MSVTSALPLALTAYESGELFGRALPFVLGAALLVAGLVRRSRSAPAAYDAWSAAGAPAPAGAPVAGAGAPAGPDGSPPAGAPAGAPFAGGSPGAPPSGWTPAPATPRRRGTGLVIAGAVLLGIGVLSVLAAVVQGAGELAETRVERTVALPDEVVGLPRDPALSEQVEADFTATGDAPPGAQVGAYTDQQDVLLVIAAPARITDLEAEVVSYRGGVEESGSPLGEGTRVDPGPLGGTARCWSTDFEGTPGATCVFVDGGSILSTIDLGTTDVQEAGERGRQARAATVTAG